MGRRSKLTPGLQEAICESLKAGNTRRCATGLVGITPETFYRWFEENVTFHDAVLKAEAEAEDRFAKLIHTAAANPQTWQASAWWLERRRHEDWRKRDEISHTGKDGGPLVLKWDDGRSSETEGKTETEAGT